MAEDVEPDPGDARGILSGDARDLTEAERTTVEALLRQGRMIEIVPRRDVRTPDFVIDGARTVLKTLSGVANRTPDALSSAMANRIMNGRGQADHILVDVRDQPGMTPRSPGVASGAPTGPTTSRGARSGRSG